MSKYNEVMNKIEVTDEMRARVLRNIEADESLKTVATTTNNSKSGGESDPAAESGKKKSASGAGDKKKKAAIITFRKYAGVAAALFVLLVGSYAVINVFPGRDYSSSTMETAETEVHEEAAETIVYEEAPAAEVAGTESYDEAAMTDVNESSAKTEEYAETTDSQVHSDDYIYDTSNSAAEPSPAPESSSNIFVRIFETIYTAIRDFISGLFD